MRHAWTGALLAALAMAGGAVTGGNTAQARGAGLTAGGSTGFTVRGHTLLRDGRPWTPYGFTLSEFQNGRQAFAKFEYATVTAQLRAIRGAWHGNTVRFQVEQDEYLYGGDGHTAADYRARVARVIAYARNLGLAVVINDQTEGQDGIRTLNEPLPTAATLAFWRALRPYRSDPDVILDPFNEPRYYPQGKTLVQDWVTWYDGSAEFVSANTLIRDLRAMGFGNQLWMEAPGNRALAPLVAHLREFRLTGTDVVYEYHHTTVDQDAVPSAAQWDAQFGNLVKRDDLPVVDGEWTNRSLPPTVKNITYHPSGDAGECWGNAPVSVPAYLAYLHRLGIGLTAWTLGPNPDLPSRSYLNADGDHSTYTTANSYADWHGCISAAPTAGAGALLKRWFAASDKTP